MIRLTSAALRPASMRRISTSLKCTTTLRHFSSPTGQVHNATDYDFSTLVEMQTISCERNKNRPLFGTLRTKHTTNANTAVTNPAEEYEYQWMSYGEFNEEVGRFRAVLSDLGVTKGDKVAIISNNRVEWAALLYAVNGLGAALVPMYEAQSPKDWEFIVNDCDAKLLLVANDAILKKTLGFIGKVGVLKGVYCLDPTPNHDHSMQRLLLSASGSSTPASIAPSTPAVIIYTSGTTGKPKGVILSHKNIVSNLYGLKDLRTSDLHEDHRSLAFLPWSHVFGLTAEMNSLLAQGASMAIVPQRELLLSCLSIANPTMIVSVPMLFNRVYDTIHAKLKNESDFKRSLVFWALNAARTRNAKLEMGKEVSALENLAFAVADKVVLSKLRAKVGPNLQWMGSGGAAVNVKVLQFFEDIGIPIAEGYGLTETSPVITASANSWAKRRLGCVGVPLKGNIVKILDPVSLDEVAEGAEGEICCAGDNVMEGYYKNEKADAEVFFQKFGLKFFRTGDMGRMVDGKFLQVTGRIKEQYKLENGKYVVPAPLEDILTRSPFLSQVLLYGDNKPFNVLLVVPDLPAIETWAKKENISAANTSELLNHSSVIELISSEIRQTELKNYERPKKWVYLPSPFTQENGMLTPKMSQRRNNIIKAYSKQLDNMYSNIEGYDV